MMSRSLRHPARRIVVLSVGGLTLGMLVAIVVSAVPVLQYYEADSRAVAEASGVVTRAGLGDDKDEGEVAWRDAAGAPHLARSTFYHPDQWPAGEPFAVRYDPAKPGGQVFPARGFDGYVESSVSGDVALLVAVTLIYLLMLAGWLVRGLLAWAAASGTVSYWLALPLDGVSQRAHSPTLALVPKAMAETGDPEGQGYGVVLPEGSRWQRVLWDPALDRMQPGEVVTARIGSGWARRAVVELPDGTRIWPAGRLRTRPYWGYQYDFRPALYRKEYAAVGARAIDRDPDALSEFAEMIKDASEVPSDQPADPADEKYAVEDPLVRLHPKVPYLLLLFVLGAVAGLGYWRDPLGLIAGAGALCGLGMSIWGLSGGEPASS
jgi:hypothetical protein